MNSYGRALRTGLHKLCDIAQETIESAGELVIWRHQIVGERNPLSDNIIGQDPKGKTWKTVDVVVRALVQPTKTEIYVYGQFAAVPGDLIIRLIGTPQSEAAALRAARASFLCVVKDPDIRRDSYNKIIYSKMTVAVDRSGRWQDYNLKGDAN